MKSKLFPTVQPPRWLAAAPCGLIAAWPGPALCQPQPPIGFPEQHLLLFGSVTNVAGGLPLPNAAVTWQI
jgi:hypothetical protein